jgi:arsenate reductase (thioredoxin)
MAHPHVRHDASIASVIDRLTGEFAGVLGRPTIERYVNDCLTQPLFQGGRITTYVPLLVERFARDRLRAVAQLEGVMPKDRPEVLFVCIHNAGRSQMAAALTHVLRSYLSRPAAR